MFEPAVRARILPFALYLAFILIADLLGRLGWDGQQLRGLYAVKILAVVLALVWHRRHYSELARPRLSLAAAGYSVLAGVLVFVLWINLGQSWMVMGSSAGFDPRDGAGTDWSLVAVRLAGGALVVPLMEELFWRSFLLRWVAAPEFLQVAPARVGWKAVAVSSVLFGVEHNLWLAGIIAGLAYSLLYMRSGSLWSPIVAHGVTNGVLGGWIISTGHWTYW